MGRRGGGGMRGGRARRSPSPAPKKRAASTSAKKQAPASKPAAPAASPMMGGGGPSFLGTLAASMAGSAAGHVLARGLMNAFEGNASPAEMQEIKEATTSIEVPEECRFQSESFKRCVESATSDSLSQCKWAWEMLGECTQKAAAAAAPGGGNAKEWI